MAGRAIVAFCFDCFKTYGKAARYQPHLVAVSQDQPGWLELTCTRCGSKCYMRPTDRAKGGEAHA